MATQSNASDQLFLLDTREDLQEHLLNMLKKGRKDIAIFSHKLDPVLFNNDSISAAISGVARSSHASKVRIAIEQPQVLVESSHQILSLAQRLVSKISIQKVTIEPQDSYQFVIVDRDKLWLQHSEEHFTGFANYDARPEVKRFLAIFNELWKYSEEDSRLRVLSL